MNKYLSGVIVGALATGVILGAGSAQADVPKNPSPWDYTGDVAITVPFFGGLKFVGENEWRQNYRGIKGPRGASVSGPKSHERPGD